MFSGHGAVYSIVYFSTPKASVSFPPRCSPVVTAVTTATDLPQTSRRCTRNIFHARLQRFGGARRVDDVYPRPADSRTVLTSRPTVSFQIENRNHWPGRRTAIFGYYVRRYYNIEKPKPTRYLYGRENRNVHKSSKIFCHFLRHHHGVLELWVGKKICSLYALEMKMKVINSVETYMNFEYFKNLSLQAKTWCCRQHPSFRIKHRQFYPQNT